MPPRMSGRSHCEAIPMYTCPFTTIGEDQLYPSFSVVPGSTTFDRHTTAPSSAASAQRYPSPPPTYTTSSLRLGSSATVAVEVIPRAVVHVIASACPRSRLQEGIAGRLVTGVEDAGV